jgi:hypothetical protein
LQPGTPRKEMLGPLQIGDVQAAISSLLNNVVWWTKRIPLSSAMDGPETQKLEKTWPPWGFGPAKPL